MATSPPALSSQLLLCRTPFMFSFLLCCLGCCRSQDLNFSLQYPFSQNDYSSGTSGGISTTIYNFTDTRYNATQQVTYKKPLRIWDRAYNYTASFNTSFLLSMGLIAKGNTTGGGATFFLSSQNASDMQLENSYGEGLGLFNVTPAGADQYSMRPKLVAVEFDIFKDPNIFDPDDNHVGIDINSSVSILTEALTPWNVSLNRNNTMSPNDGVVNTTNTMVWIDYDGHGHMLDVYLANTDLPMMKPLHPVISQFRIDLRQYLPETIYIGFSASSGTSLERYVLLIWNFTSEGLPVSSGHSTTLPVSSSHPTTLPVSSSHPTTVPVGLTAGGAALVVLLLVGTVLILVARSKKKRKTHLFQSLASLHYGPHKFTYRELRKATNNFSADCLLGKGGFGSVYRGTLPSDNSAVAVKCLSQQSKQGEREFIAEVTIIGRLRHKNLVQLLGWCHDSQRGRLLLVYEYMPNGSLDKWLKAESTDEVLGWERRYHVLKGLAAGLLYLHEEWEMVVVHRDLKPSNLMLDAEFNARLGDFGLARLINGSDGKDLAETRNITGTPGYMAPEYMQTGVVTKESDLYSFGAVVIEVATGKRLSPELLHSLLLLHEEDRLLEAADQRLASYDASEMERLLMLGLACCHPHPPSRPNIRQVAQALSSSSPFPVPSFPIPSFPSLPSDRSPSQASFASSSTQNLSAR